MCFYNRLPLDWTLPETHDLHALLSSAYPRPKHLEAIVVQAGMKLADIPLGDTVRAVWRETMNALRNRDLLRTLIELAANDDTIPAYNERFREVLQGQPRVTTRLREQASGVPDFWDGPPANPNLMHERLLSNRRAILPVTTAEGIVQTSRSVAKLYLSYQEQEGAGTGFLIAPQLLLTNHHNLHHPVYGDALHIVAVFGSDDEEHIRCSRVPSESSSEWIENKALDWAILRLEEPLEREPLRLGTQYPIKEDDMVIIIQHPGGGEKQFSMEHEAIHRITEHHLQYLADTEPGSSGSPVLNRRLEVIALHHASSVDSLDIQGESYSFAYNQGILIDSILQDFERLGFQINP